MHDHNALNIYTDGSCYSSPRRGGIGIRFVFPDSMNREELDFQPDGYIGATNNQMELKACIEALNIAKNRGELNQASRIIIHTDSQYVVDNHYAACYSWPKNGWRTAKGTPVQNVDSWKELIKSEKKVRKRVDYYWVKGHSKNKHNKAADKLAKKSANNATKTLPGLIVVRRKISKKSVEYGSIKMLGQRIKIRVITAEYLRGHKIYRYKYEVMSTKSKFYENVDIAYSSEILRTHRTYLVSFNTNSDYPQILRILGEVEK